MRILSLAILSCVFAAAAMGQTTAVLFEGVKLFYQDPGKEKFKDLKGTLALDSAQKVMMLLKDNKPWFVARYDNVTQFSFEEKRDKTLTVKYQDAPGPSGLVRLELGGKWKNILEMIRNQSGKTVEMIKK